MQRRQVVRRPPKTFISVNLLVEGYIVSHGELADLSLEGAGLWTAEDFQIGEIVDIYLKAEDTMGLSFRGTAKVLWCRPAAGSAERARCGCSWAHLANVEKTTLGRFISLTCTEH